MQAGYVPIGGDVGDATFELPSSARGSSRGLPASASGRRVPVLAQQQRVPTQRVIEGYHGAQTQLAFYAPDWTAHSMRSTRDRGMKKVARWPNTLPWAFDRVANSAAFVQEQGRMPPQRTAIIEEPTSKGVGEDAWMPGVVGEGVIRTSNPSMAGSVARVAAEAPLLQSRARLPYVHDSRNFSAYHDGKDQQGMQGLEFMLLKKHHLLPNKDEDIAGYDIASEDALPDPPPSATLAPAAPVMQQDADLLRRG
jgi:hypothetical protein